MSVSIREAINIAFKNNMKIDRYGSLQYQVMCREDLTVEHSRLVDSLEEAVEIMPEMRRERNEEYEQQQGDKSWL